MKKTLMMLLAMVLLAACGGKQTTTTVTAEQLEGKWILQTVEGNALPETGNTEKPYMVYTLTENRFACFVGCNRMGGNLSFDNGTIALTNAFATKMLCPYEDAMQLENRLGLLLDKVTTVSMSGETLILADAQGNEILTMVKE